jgi:hypothetical protein
VGKHIYLIAALLALVAGYVCWTGAPLIWDGAYQLCFTLITDRPYFYLSRFHSAILWYPTVLAGRVTDDAGILTIIYGLPFCLAPAVGLLASWLVVRRQAPTLVIWAAMGILAGTLPGQIFIINDSNLQMHLFWPLFLAMLVRLGPWQLALLMVLGVFQFSHPIGIATFFGAGLAAAAMAFADAPGRRMHLGNAMLMAGFSMLAALKLVIWPDSYAEQQASVMEALGCWRKGVSGWPIRGLALVWVASGLIVAGRLSGSRGLRWLALAPLVAGSAMWIYWSADEYRWAGAIDYRRWILPLSFPFFACALLERMVIIRRPPGLAEEAGRSDAIALPAWILAITFSIVLCLQGTQWMGLSRRLMADVRAHPGAVVPPGVVQWARGTPLDHWGMLSLVMLHQGQAPAKLLLDQQTIQVIFADPPAVPLSPFTPISPLPGPNGWFDFRPVVEEIRHLP